MNTLIAGRIRSYCFGIDHLLQIRRNQLGFYEQLRARHGDAVSLRLGPYRSWILFHPDAVEALLTSQWTSFIRFKRLTKVLAQWNGDSLLLAEGEDWRLRRRKVMPAFQTRRFDSYANTVVDHAARFVARMDAEADGRNEVAIDTDAAMARLTLDIAVGTLFGSEPPDNGDEVVQALHALSDIAFSESTSPLMFPDWFPVAAKRKKRWAIEVMDRLVKGLVDRALRREGDDVGDLVSMLIEHHNRDATAIRNDAMSLLIAGHETSGALLSWVFACLAVHPNWLDRVTAQMREVLDDRLPRIDDLPRMNFLRAVVEETLRLYPPAYSLFLRQAIEDVTLVGIRIRKGDLVQIVPFALHHDSRWFECPDAFEPERFLRDPVWPRYAYLPFGAGPRVCIGQNFALMEACLVVAAILQRWRPSTNHEMPEMIAKFSLRPMDGSISWQRPVGPSNRR